MEIVSGESKASVQADLENFIGEVPVTWGQAREKLNDIASILDKSPVPTSPGGLVRSRINALMAEPDQFKIRFNDKLARIQGSGDNYIGEPDELLTVTRATGGISWVDGEWKWVGENLPRYDVDGSLLIERQSTNLFINSVFAEAASGTPGTLPTSWTTGTRTGTLLVEESSFEGANKLNISVSNQQYGLYQTISSGDIKSFSTYIFSMEIDVIVPIALVNLSSIYSSPSGSTLTRILDGVIRPSNFLPSVGKHLLEIRLVTASATSAINCFLGVGIQGVNSTGHVIIENPMFERATGRSSYIPTTVAAVTRAADRVSIPVADIPYSNTENTFIIEGKASGQIPTFMGIENVKYAGIETSDDLSDLTNGNYADDESAMNNDPLVVNTVGRARVGNNTKLAGYTNITISTQHLVLPRTSDLDFGTNIDFSIAFWVKYQSTTQSASLLSYSDPAKADGTLRSWALRISDTEKQVAYTQNPGGGVAVAFGLATGNMSLSDNANHLIVFTRIGTTTNLYLNGVLKATTESSIDMKTEGAAPQLYIGINKYGTTALDVNLQQNILSLIRVARAGMTAEQVARLYETERVYFEDNADFTMPQINTTDYFLPSTQVIWQADNGTQAERIRAERDANGQVRVRIDDNGIEQAELNLGPVVNGENFKLQASIKENAVRASLNDGAVVQDTSATLPTVTTLRLGNSSLGEQLNGTIKNFNQIAEESLT